MNEFSPYKFDSEKLDKLSRASTEDKQEQKDKLRSEYILRIFSKQASSEYAFQDETFTLRQIRGEIRSLSGQKDTKEKLQKINELVKKIQTKIDSMDVLINTEKLDIQDSTELDPSMQELEKDDPDWKKNYSKKVSPLVEEQMAWRYLLEEIDKIKTRDKPTEEREGEDEASEESRSRSREETRREEGVDFSEVERKALAFLENQDEKNKDLDIEDAKIVELIKELRKEIPKQELILETRKKQYERASEGKDKSKSEIREALDAFVEEKERLRLFVETVAKYERLKQQKEGRITPADKKNYVEEIDFESRGYNGLELKEKIVNECLEQGENKLRNLTSIIYLVKKLNSENLVSGTEDLIKILEDLSEREENKGKLADYLDSQEPEGLFEKTGSAIKNLELGPKITVNVDYPEGLDDEEKNRYKTAARNNISEEYRDLIKDTVYSCLAKMIVDLEISFEGADMISSKAREFDNKFLTIDQILGVMNSYKGFFEVTDTSNMAITKVLEKRKEQLLQSMEARGVDKDFIAGFMSQIDNIKDALDFGFLRNDVLNYRYLGARWTKDAEGNRIPQVVERMSSVISIGKKGIDAQRVNTNINGEQQTMKIGEYFDNRLEWSDEMGILQQILCVVKQELMKQPIGSGLRSKNGADESKYSMANLFNSQEKVNDLIGDVIEGRVQYTFFNGEPIKCKNKEGRFEEINIAKTIKEMNLGSEEKAILMQMAMMLASARDFGGDATSYHMAYNLTASKLPPEATDPRTFDKPAAGIYYESRNNQEKIPSCFFVLTNLEAGSLFNREDADSPGFIEKYEIAAKATTAWARLMAEFPQLQNIQFLEGTRSDNKEANTDERYVLKPAELSPEDNEGRQTYKDYCVCHSFDGRVLPSIGHFVSQRERKLEQKTGDEKKQIDASTYPPDAYLKLFAAHQRLFERGDLATNLEEVKRKFFTPEGEIKHDDIVQEISSCNTDIAILMSYLGPWKEKTKLCLSSDVLGEIKGTEALKNFSVDDSDMSRFHEAHKAAYMTFVMALRLSVPGEIDYIKNRLMSGEASRNLLNNRRYKMKIIAMREAILQGVNDPDRKGGLKEEFRRHLIDGMKVDLRTRGGYDRMFVGAVKFNDWLIELANSNKEYLRPVSKILPGYLEVREGGKLVRLEVPKEGWMRRKWFQEDRLRMPSSPFLRRVPEK